MKPELAGCRVLLDILADASQCIQLLRFSNRRGEKHGHSTICLFRVLDPATRPANLFDTRIDTKENFVKRGWKLFV